MDDVEYFYPSDANPTGRQKDGTPTPKMLLHDMKPLPEGVLPSALPGQFPTYHDNTEETRPWIAGNNDLRFFLIRYQHELDEAERVPRLLIPSHETQPPMACHAHLSLSLPDEYLEALEQLAAELCTSTQDVARQILGKALGIMSPHRLDFRRRDEGPPRRKRRMKESPNEPV